MSVFGGGVSIPGQFYFDLIISGTSIVETPDDVITFSEVSESGNRCPQFYFNLHIRKEHLGKFHQGLKFTVKWGATLSAVHIRQVEFQKMENQQPAGRNKVNVQFFCLLAISEYQNQPENKIYDKDKIADTLKTAASPFFNKTYVTAKGWENQKLVRIKSSAKRFVDINYLHINCMPGFPAVGITPEKEFKLINVMLESFLPKHFFGISEKYKIAIPYTTMSASDNTASIQNSVGYGRAYNIKYQDTGKEKTFRPFVMPCFSHQLPQFSKDTLFKSAIDLVTNDNHHSMWYQAYLHNMLNLNMVNNYQVSLTFQNILVDIEILDVAVLVDDIDLTKYDLGTYICTKVVHSIERKSIWTRIILSREGRLDKDGVDNFTQWDMDSLPRYFDYLQDSDYSDLYNGNYFDADGNYLGNTGSVSGYVPISKPTDTNISDTNNGQLLLDDILSDINSAMNSAGLSDNDLFNAVENAYRNAMDNISEDGLTEQAEELRGNLYDILGIMDYDTDELNGKLGFDSNLASEVRRTTANCILGAC
jgi:hypothetical protein